MITNHLSFKKDLNTKNVFILQKALELDKRLLKEYKNKNCFGVYLSPIQKDKQSKYKATHRLTDSFKHLTRLREIEGVLNVFIGDIQNSEELLIIETNPNLTDAKELDIYVLDIKKPSTDLIEGLVKSNDIRKEIMRLHSQSYLYNINSNLSPILVNQ